jgi:hypothetical protein
MTRFNAAVLIQLASTQVQEVAGQFGNVAPKLRASLDELAAKRLKEVTDAAAAEILNTVSAAEEFINVQAQAVVQFRDNIKRAEDLMGAIQRAKAYGFETQNFVPLLVLLGQPVGLAPKNVITEVPKNWAPAVVAPAADVAATPATR